MHHPLLRYLDEVAHQGSIRKAAKVLNVSSSAVNRQILKLEEELGTRVFNRIPEGVTLTEAGRLVIEHCRNTLYDFKNVCAAVDDLRDLREGHIAISTLDSLTFNLLPKVFSEFTKAYPKISYTVKTANVDEAIDDVVTNRSNIAIGFSKSEHPDVRLMAEKPSPFGLIVWPNHPLIEKPFVRLSDCESYPLVRTIDARGRTSIIDKEKTINFMELSTIFYTNSLLMAKRAISQQIGIGLYTKIGFMEEIISGSLVFIPMAETPLMNYKIGVFISSHKNPDTPTRLFTSALERELRRVDFT